MPAEAFALGTVSKLTHWTRCCRGWLWLPLLATSSYAQTCQSAADMEPSLRGSIETGAKRYFEMAAHGDTAALKQNAIPTVAANFTGIEAAVKETQGVF